MGAFEPVLWAMKHAPVKDLEEWAVLVAMAETADDDGCNAFNAQSTYAKRIRTSTKTVQRRMEGMEERGLIARGNQAAASYIPADKRPVVYDLMIPYSWFSDIEQTNEERAKRGLSPLTAENRPDLGPPPEKKRRADLGRKKREPEQEDDGTTSPTAEQDEPNGRTTSPVGLEDRSDSESRAVGLQVQSGRTTSPTTHPFNPPLNPPQRETRARTREAAGPRGAGLHTLPEDFKLTDAMRRWSVATFGNALDPDYETERFVSHYRDEGSRRRSWPDTWQQWMRRSARYATQRAQRVSPNGHPAPSRNAQILDAAMQRALAAEGGQR